MKTGNNLNKALKDALQNQPEPLVPHQWDRLKNELEDKKKKTPFFWLFFFGVASILTGFIGYYFGTQNTNNLNSAKIEANAPLISKNANPSNLDLSIDSTQLNENAISRGNQNSPNPQNENKKQIVKNNISVKPGEISTQLNSSPNNPPNPVLPNKNISSNGSGLISNSLKNENSKGNLETENKENSTDKLKESFNINSIDLSTHSPTDFDWSLAVLLPDAPERMIDIEWIDFSAYNKTPKKLKNPRKSIVPPGNGIVLGMQFGFSNVFSKSSINENDNKMHEDSKSIFDKAAQNQKSNLFKLSLDYMIFPSLSISLNTGLQYRSVTQTARYDYDYNKAPFRDVDNSILFYIDLKDSLGRPPFVISGENVNTLHYLSLPLSVNYTLPINSKNEILLGLGGQLNILLKSKGQLFDVNDLSLKSTKELIKTKVNLSYLGSIGYSRFLWKNWWLGFDIGIQNQNLKYGSEYGEIKNSLKFNSINLNLRYKL